MQSRILVIDDEPQIHRFLRPALEASGFVVERADTAADGLRLAASRAPSCILLDLGLPDMDGLTALEQLRQWSRVPVLILSARDQEGQKVAALDSGADDYVEKPFGVAELLARIRVALRHAQPGGLAQERFSHGGLDVDLAQRQVRVAGTAVTLSRREFDLLALLVRNAGRVMTHRQLLTSVWGPAHASDVQYLRVYIGQLRQKLSLSGAVLQTEAGVGYRMQADIQTMEGSNRP